MNCEFLLNISNFWNELWKFDKDFVTNFNDLNFLNDLYEYKLIVLKNSYKNMKLSFNQIEKKIVSFVEFFVLHNMLWILIIVLFDMNSQWIIICL